MAGKRVIPSSSSGGHTSQSGGRRTIQKKKKGKAKRRIRNTLIALVVLVGMYLTAVFSPIPVIAKWRTLYIETAMSTFSHKWLATYFIPGSVIDKVMADVNADIAAQETLSSNWDDSVSADAPTVAAHETSSDSEDEPDTDTETAGEVDEEAEAFFETYWELDTDSVRSYLKKNPSLVSDGYDNLLIEDLNCKLGLKSVNGDEVCVIDTENNLVIFKIAQDNYEGKLAIVKNPAQLDVAKSKHLGAYGEILTTLADDNNAVLAINASGFGDAEGHGNGGLVVGSLVIDGVDYGYPEYAGSGYKFFGFKDDDRLYIGNYDTSTVSEYRFALQFFPALIVDGKSVVDGSYGMGLQPRSTFGQAQNGDVLLLVIDGRQVGHSLGCTVSDCTKIMLNYGAYQATNLDGGSSSLMVYKGQKITSPSSVSSEGRYLPDCLIVRAASDVD